MVTVQEKPDGEDPAAFFARTAGTSNMLFSDEGSVQILDREFDGFYPNFVGLISFLLTLFRDATQTVTDSLIENANPGGDARFVTASCLLYLYSVLADDPDVDAAEFEFGPMAIPKTIADVLSQFGSWVKISSQVTVHTVGKTELLGRVLSAAQDVYSQGEVGLNSLVLPFSEDDPGFAYQLAVACHRQALLNGRKSLSLKDAFEIVHTGSDTMRLISTLSGFRGADALQRWLLHREQDSLFQFLESDLGRRLGFPRIPPSYSFNRRHSHDVLTSVCHASLLGHAKDVWHRLGFPRGTEVGSGRTNLPSPQLLSFLDEHAYYRYEDGKRYVHHDTGALVSSYFLPKGGTWRLLSGTGLLPVVSGGGGKPLLRHKPQGLGQKTFPGQTVGGRDDEFGLIPTFRFYE